MKILSFKRMFTRLTYQDFDTSSVKLLELLCKLNVLRERSVERADHHNFYWKFYKKYNDSFLLRVHSTLFVLNLCSTVLANNWFLIGLTLLNLIDILKILKRRNT